MTHYYVTVNHTTQFPLFYWDPYNSEALFIATDDLAAVKAAFTNVEHISITNDEGLEVAVFTQFDRYSSINYMGRNYSNQIDDFADELAVYLTKIDLVQQVQRIEEQVNPVIDFDGMTLDEYKEWKIDQLSDMGEATIFAGTDVQLTDGTTKNFTYDLEDQSNLLNAIFIIQALDDLTITLPYHEHGQACELYGALDILAIYISLQIFSTTVQTLTNMRINWVRSCATKDEIRAIEFDTPLPEDWQARADAVLVPAMEIVNELKKKYFPETTEE